MQRNVVVKNYRTAPEIMKLVTLRLTGKRSFWIKHDCCSMMDSNLMYCHHFYSPFINTMSTVLHLKEGRLNPQQQKTDPNITRSKNSLNVPGHLLFPHIRKTPPGVNHGKEVTVQTFPSFFWCCRWCLLCLEDLGPKAKRKKQGNDLRICKFWLASASSWLTRLILQNYIQDWDPRNTTSQFCSYEPKVVCTTKIEKLPSQFIKEVRRVAMKTDQFAITLKFRQ